MPKALFRLKFIIFCLSLLLFSCSGTRLLPDNQQLVVKNKIEGLPVTLKSEAQTLIRPRPNRKFLGLFRFNMWLYLVNSNKNESRFSESIKKTIGEPPAIYDTITQEQTIQTLKTFLFSKGYFNNDVSINTEYVGKRKNKVSLTYTAKVEQPYRVRSFRYEDTLQVVSPLIEATMSNRIIRDGDVYSQSALDNERNRITNYLRNRGYFFFNKDFLYFEVDTNLGLGEAEIFLKIKEPKEAYYYKPFFINNLQLNTTFSLFGETDTTKIDTIYLNGVRFLMHQDPVVKPEVLFKRLSITPGAYFSQQKLQNTQNKLNEMGLWSYLNIRQTPMLSDTLTGRLNLDILMSPAPKRELDASFESSTNAISALGISGFLALRNKNTFKGGEQFEIRINGGIESQQLNTVTENTNIRLPFNTFEYGALVSLQIPDFIFPFRKLNKDERLVPNTKLLASYNQQNRIDYQRAISTIRFGYEWSNRTRETFAFYPFEINLATTPRIDSILKATIEQRQDPYLAFSFTNHLTTSSRFVYTSNRLSNNNIRKQYFFRMGIESAGNLLNTLYPVLNKSENEFPRTFLRLPYFQYILSDIEYRKYWVFNPSQILATRFFIGLGIPLSNSTTLPLEKRFFAGGNNSLRAWLARSIGPGSYTNYRTQRIDQFAELRLEANFEERFDIIGKLKGAVFVDFGNIWATKDTVSFRKEFTNFKLNRFYKEFAIGSGFGLRMDFGYFIIRVDLGIKLHDPAFTTGNRWVIRNLFNNEWRMANWQNNLNQSFSENLGNYRFFNLNLGIGFPF